MPWVFRRQVRQDLLVDRVLAECRLLLPEAKAPQPTSDVHGGAPVRLALHDPLRETACLGERPVWVMSVVFWQFAECLLTPLTAGRVEMWRGDGRLNISVCRLFRLAVP